MFSQFVRLTCVTTQKLTISYHPRFGHSHVQRRAYYNMQLHITVLGTEMKAASHGCDAWNLRHQCSKRILPV
jgi:hypothetical protein